MEIYVIAAAVLYWTFAVASVAILASTYHNPGILDIAWVIGISALWPILAIGVAVIAMYHIPISSANAIRRDLKNRGLLREFEQWLKTRDTSRG